MLEPDEHFKHLTDNPTYFRPEDWRDLDGLIDWIIEKNKAGYQMVNSVQRLEEMKTFVRMSSGLKLREVGWYGDGEVSDVETAAMLKKAAGIVQGENGELNFAEWSCRAGQNNVIVRTDGTVAPCFPMYSASYDWGNIETFTFDHEQLSGEARLPSEAYTAPKTRAEAHGVSALEIPCISLTQSGRASRCLPQLCRVLLTCFESFDSFDFRHFHAAFLRAQSNSNCTIEAIYANGKIRVPATI